MALKFEIQAKDVDAIYVATDLLRNMVKADVFFGTKFKELDEEVREALSGLAGIFPVNIPPVEPTWTTQHRLAWNNGFRGPVPPNGSGAQ
jgi:hypothetical protein